MTFITQVYEQLRTANIISSGEDFSVRFLKRSPKYYSAIKAQGRDANVLLLSNVLLELMKRRRALQQRSLNPRMVNYFGKEKYLEDMIATKINEFTSALIAEPLEGST